MAMRRHPLPSSSAKLMPPRLARVLSRERLFSRIDAARTRPVVWISAPPGSGKTTLVGSYLQARSITTIWYQLDDGDSDPATFFYQLGLAAQRGRPGRKPELPLLTPEFASGVRSFARNWFRALYASAKSPCAMVFDNYQDLPARSDLHAALAAGFAEAPEGISVICLSRRPPPREYARLRANSALEELGWDDLRLDARELRELARLRGHDDAAAAVDLLMERTQGWAAGVVLLGDAGEIAGEMPAARATFRPEALFDYFAGEVFDGLPRVRREFLVKTALLPRMSPAMAAALTGDSSAGEALADLCARNYFTTRHGGVEPAYQYHPLFREFLLARLDDVVSPVQRTVFRWNAASLLAEDGQVDAAAELFSAVEDWPALARVLIDQAPSLLAQGRHRSLQKHLTRLPQEVRSGNPWALYYLGACCAELHPASSGEWFRMAFDFFEKEDNATGVYLAWAGIINAIVFDEESDLRSAVAPLSRLDELRDRFPQFADPGIELQVASAALMLLTRLMLRDPRLDAWRDRAIALAEESPDPSLRMHVYHVLADYWIERGHLAKTRELLNASRALAQARDSAPFWSLGCDFLEAILLRWTGDASAARRVVTDGLAHSQRIGLHHWDNALLAQGIGAALASDDIAAASAMLGRMSGGGLDRSGQCGGYVRYFSGWLALHRGRADEAVRQLSTAVEIVDARGHPYYQGMFRAGLGVALTESLDFEEARRVLSESAEFARHIDSLCIEYACRVAAAWLAFRTGDEATMDIEFRQALTLARDQDFGIVTAVWHVALAELCCHALRRGIETGLVRTLVRRCHLTAREPPLDLPGWPWELELWCLGNVRLARHGDPIVFAGKAPKKPLALLKCIVAYGGTGVAETRLIEALWPDQEADAAHSALTSTMHRLRELIGPDCVEVSEGKVSLDRRRCWVDVWALMQSLKRAEGPASETSAAAMDAAMQLYAGHFLNDEPDAIWATSLREQLRSQFMRAVERLGIEAERAGNWERALTWYRKALELDPLVEPLYQGLIRSHLRLGLPSQAADAYHRCRRMLSISLGVAPSAATEALFRQIGA